VWPKLRKDIFFIMRETQRRQGSKRKQRSRPLNHRDLSSLGRKVKNIRRRSTTDSGSSRGEIWTVGTHIQIVKNVHRKRSALNQHI
jgi:hypothetical protein